MDGGFIINKMLSLRWLGHSPRGREIVFDLIDGFFLVRVWAAIWPVMLCLRRKVTKRGGRQETSRENKELAAECL